MNKYTNSPIVEALCQFNFISDNKWDWTIPGLVFNSIKDEYPKKRELKRFGVEFKPLKDELDTRFRHGIDKMQFLNQEENRLIQIGNNLLSINHLKPYINWNNFKEDILNALNIYNEITQPRGITRVGLRYINHIENLPETCEIEDYFAYYPHFPKEDQNIIGDLFLRSLLPVPNIEDLEGRLALTFAITQNKNTNNQIFILDLDIFYNWSPEEALSIESISDKLDEAHEFIVKTFESCIKDPLREKFN